MTELCLQMIFTRSPELAEYMARKKKTHIVLDVAKSDHSDFDVSELFVRLADKEHASYLVEKKRFRERTADGFSVLLPNYILEYDEEVHFSFRHALFLRLLHVDGAHL